MRPYSFKQIKLSNVCAGVLMGCVLASCAALPNQSIKPPVYELTDYGVSAAAADTQAAPYASYENANQMLENADMAAFMLAARDAYEAGDKAGAWGFTALDMMLAGEYEFALLVLDKMPEKAGAWPAMTPAFIRPWVYAAKGDLELAKEAVKPLKRLMADHSYRGYQALMFEGMGQNEEALKIYDLGPKIFDRPGDDEVTTTQSYARFLIYSAERVLALRHADLLVKLERDADAMAIYTALLEANEDDGFTKARRDELVDGEKRVKPFHTVQTGFGIALNDQAEQIEQRQVMAGVVLAKGAKAPFNHFLSAIRQSASLLNPSSALVRLTEADHLYRHGFFEASARYALIGEAETKDDEASLLLRASEASLKAGKPESMESLNKRALSLTDEPFTRLNVADLMVKINNTDRAEELIQDILADDDLDIKTRAYANILLAEARQQAGNIAGAQEAARIAVDLEETDQTRGFLAATLSKSDDTREEGLDLYRELFIEMPDSPGMMNNFGYALVSDPMSAKELDEGYRLLKKANRMTPFEPNLLDSLGWAYYQYGDYERAEELIVKALELFEPFDHWELHYHLGDVYWRLDKKEDARKAWETALTLHPPELDSADIALRLENGLTEAAPEARVPPFIPKDEAPPEKRSI